MSISDSKKPFAPRHPAANEAQDMAGNSQQDVRQQAIDQQGFLTPAIPAMESVSNPVGQTVRRATRATRHDYQAADREKNNRADSSGGVAGPTVSAGQKNTEAIAPSIGQAHHRNPTVENRSMTDFRTEQLSLTKENTTRQLGEGGARWLPSGADALVSNKKIIAEKIKSKDSGRANHVATAPQPSTQASSGHAVAGQESSGHAVAGQESSGHATLGPDWPDFWARLMRQFRAQYGDTAYRRFFASLAGVACHGGVFTFRADNSFQAEWVQKNYRYWLLQRFQWEKWPVNEIDVLVGDDASNITPVSNGTSTNHQGAAPIKTDGHTALHAVGTAMTTAMGDRPRRLLGSELMEQFQFDHLVVGESNEEAVNAARQMLENFPQLPFNPLFIYGPVGFGKTHLLHAIGLYLKQRFPRKKLLYFTAENFLQNFVTALRQKEIFSFDNNFADIDCLLIDDLHFILGKEGALKALETIVGQFLDRGKMMVLVADRGPQQLQQLGPRILSRLRSGFATELKPLTSDMRKAILRLKALQKNIDLPDNTIEWLAEKLYDTNRAVSPRELSGIINQLMIKLDVNRKSPLSRLDLRVLSPEQCQKLLADFFRPERRQITVDNIQQAVAEYYDISLPELLGKSRVQDVAKPRQIAMYLAKQATARSLPSIGTRFNRDHTTVIHAIRVVEQRMMDNPKFQEEVMHLLHKLKLGR